MNKKLIELIDNSLTDKNTTHSYIDVYEKLFSKKKYDNNNILEIGIGEPYKDNRNGGSIKLWHDYFINSTVYGIDIYPITKINKIIKNKKRIELLTGHDAYNMDFVKKYISGKKYDIMIDDGPHTLESMIFFIKNYLPLLSENGILIIEDIGNMEWTNILINSIPPEFVNKTSHEIYDLRNIKNRWDDVLLVIEYNKPE
jgi:hypothetical protein